MLSLAGSAAMQTSAVRAALTYHDIVNTRCPLQSGALSNTQECFLIKRSCIYIIYTGERQVKCLQVLLLKLKRING